MTDSTHVPVLVVNAFTDTLFGGNLRRLWRLIHLCRRHHAIIVEQHNLSETAFLVRRVSTIFTYAGLSTKEVPLCGHATLASAYALDYLGHGQASASLDTGGRYVTVMVIDIALNFRPCLWTKWTHLMRLLRFQPPVVRSFRPSTGVADGVRLADEATLKACSPTFALAMATDLGVSITAASSDVDYVSRFYSSARHQRGSRYGSAHCQLVPFGQRGYQRPT